MTPSEDNCPWLPPDFEPLEMLADGTRLGRDRYGANGHGRRTLLHRLSEAVSRFPFREIVEVGSWAGGNALGIASNVPCLDQLYCVDTWAGTPARNGADSTTVIAAAISPDKVYATFLKNVRGRLFAGGRGGSGYGCGITPCRGTSEFWAKNWPHQVAAIFIDADHSYEGVKADLKGWWPHVRPGGLFCGHDYHLFPGVKQAVDEWVAAQGLELLVEEECWFVKKPGAEGEIRGWHAMPEPHDHPYGE